MGATAIHFIWWINIKQQLLKKFTIDEVIEDAYERCGVQGITGYQLKAARRSLNILFQEWGNRGLHYWEVGNTNVYLVEGQSEYIFIDQHLMVLVQPQQVELISHMVYQIY